MAPDAALYLLLLALFHSPVARAKQECIGNAFFRAEQTNEAAKNEIEFYFVEQGSPSVEACAKFCFDTQFCRTAVYDSNALTCSISYAEQRSCRGVPTIKSYPSNGLVKIDCPSCDKVGTVGSATPSTPKPTTHPPSVTPRSPAPATYPTQVEPVQQPHDSKGTGESANDILETILGTEIVDEPCFIERKQKVLVNAAFKIEQGVSLAKCKCFCASSWLSNRYSTQCKSIQYYPERSECVLNGADETDAGYGLHDLQADRGSYFSFPCRRYEHQITQFVLENNCNSLLPPPGGEKKNPSGADSQVQLDSCYETLVGYQIAGLAAGSERNVSLEQCKCLCATSLSSGKYNFECKSAMYYDNERECVLNLDDRISRPDLFRKDGSSFHVTYLGYVCPGDGTAKKYQIEDCGIDLYQPVKKPVKSEQLILTSVYTEKTKPPTTKPTTKATTTTPKPTTTTKATTTTTAAQTTTAKPSTTVASANATSASPTTTKAAATTAKQTTPKATEPTTKLPTVQPLATPAVNPFTFLLPKESPGGHTDICFLEVPNHVLQSMVAAIETGIPSQACKCYCLYSIQRYGFQCKSIQYYFSASTCLLNRESRYQKPKNFVQISSGLQHSYFDQKCELPVNGTRYYSQHECWQYGFSGTYPDGSTINGHPPAQFVTDPSRYRTPPASDDSPQNPFVTGTPVPKGPVDKNGKPLVTIPANIPTFVTGPCRYSAFYESQFSGDLIERLLVTTPLMCFRACSAMNCRSANLIMLEGILKYCELYRDAATDVGYSTASLTYDNGSVYFEGIQCVHKSV